MGHFEDAKALIAHAKEDLGKLRRDYSTSLTKRIVEKDLLIDIKNLMENLRSAMDFAAHALFDKYGASSGASPKIYFPYAAVSQDRTAFQRDGRIEKCIPGLSSNRPDIVAKLESYQHFANPSNKWLPVFMELNNENKHERLTPQTRQEQRQLVIESGGASISLGPGASINIGKGASIRFGGAIISGDQQISGEQPARIYGVGQQTVITWVSFKFDSNGEEVSSFLTIVVQNVEKIIGELETL